MANDAAIFAHDPDGKILYSRDYTDWLRSGDTVSAVTVSVVEGTATVATTLAGTPATSASAALSGAVATIAVVSASAGKVGLRWRVTSAAGEQDDKTHYIQVGDL